jgi:signal peptide peptidase SppA
MTTDHAAPAPEMPATFRAQLDAALARPCMLEPSAVERVSAGAGFVPRGDLGAEPAKPPPPFERRGNVAVVSISGALAQRAWSCWIMAGDGYDAIETRVRAAIDDADVRAVVLRIDSPGGEVAGNFECARAIRAMASAAAKPVVAYVDEMACSAAFALACAADAIVTPDTGLLGSVGVITVLADRTKQNELAGLSPRVVRSGKFKAVPHSAEPLTDDVVAHVQARVDALAVVFADHVAASRPAFADAAAVLALEGAVFVGRDAVKRGLADKAGSFADALALAGRLPRKSKMSAAASAAQTTTQQGASNMDTVIQALGLKAGAGEAEILSKVNDLVRGNTELLRAHNAQNVAAALGAVEGMRATGERLKAVEAENAQLKQQLEGKDRDALIAQGKKDGKLTPALVTLYADESPEKLRAFLAAAPHGGGHGRRALQRERRRADRPEGAHVRPAQPGRAQVAQGQRPGPVRNDARGLARERPPQQGRALAAPRA